MTDAPPNTQRSRDICECAALRHQLRLADELAKEVRSIADGIQTSNGFFLSTHQTLVLMSALRRYSEARIQAEITAPTESEQT